ncbi:hypothetical protein LS81_010755 [Helicobacter trogontum]|uniref:Uncharacterized protein n=1 Tax=Helicobacter trogontum TaxID=50960 RepID=A0A4U8S128_9HELI|nr:hypothetical protein [Helicobacter trogontum]TLD79327.1 hypothetical protein LS81_010755 [Helicobacter trogontum]
MVFFYFLFFTLSYIIWWLIYRKLFKSQKHISKFLVVLGSIGLIMFYYTPYSFYLEPSYWQFRNMCKLNELPNNEEKYNKILGYFDTSLDTLDWEELNKEAQIAHGSPIAIDYQRKVINYSSSTPKNKGRLSYNYVFLYPHSKEKFFQQNLPLIGFLTTWQTRRYFPDGNEGSGFYWSEGVLTCVDVNAEMQYLRNNNGQ